MPSFLLPLLFLVAGIFAGEKCPGYIWGGLLMGLGGALALMLLLLRRNPQAAFRQRHLHHLWLALLFSGLGWLVAEIHRPLEFPFSDHHALLLSRGEILRVETKSEFERYLVEVSEIADSKGNVWATRNFRALVTANGTLANVGDIVEIPCQWRRIANRQGYTFDYAGMMKSKGVLYRQSVGSRHFKVIGHRWSLRAISADALNRFEAAIEKSSLSCEGKGLVMAMLCGDRSYLSPEIAPAFSRVGLAHMLALSGLHIAIIGAIILWLLFPLNFSGHYKWRYIGALCAIWLFVVATGSAPSAVRAALMTTFCLSGKILERRGSALNALLGAAFMIALLKPVAVHDIGAQLSFLCVGSLVVFGGRLNAVSHHVHPRLYKLNMAVLTCLVATIATWAVTGHYFGQLPLLFLPVNLLVTPLLPLFIGGALLYIIMCWIGFDFSPLAWSISRSSELIESGASWVASLPGSSIAYQPTPAIVACWSILLLLFAITLLRKKGC